MQVLIDVSGGQDDELERLLESLQADDMVGAKVGLQRQPVRDGSLGAEQVLIFLGQNVALPLLVQALYDYLTSRRRTAAASRLRIVLSRTDLPGGARHTEVTAEGPANEVIQAVRKELE